MIKWCLPMVPVSLTVVLLVCTSGCVTDSDTTVRSELEYLFGPAYPDTGPGAAVLIARGDTVLFKDAFGHADLQHGIRMSPDHVFRIATLTKQFTAVGILQLAESGRISLDDPLVVYLPEYPVRSESITIRHLLNHSSGIPSYTDMTEFWKRSMSDLSRSEVLDLFRDKPLLFEPGTDWSYSNSGYYLLGLIIESVSGNTYDEYLRRNILRPLGMTDTDLDACCRIVPDRAVGYRRGANGFEHDRYISMSAPFSAGGMISTVEDMYRFDRALYSDTLLSGEWRNILYEPVLLEDSQAANTACGWGSFPIRGKTAHLNVGYINGFTVSSIRIPEDEIFIVILSNIIGNVPSPRTLARKAAAIVLNDPYPEWTEIHIDPSVLERYTGIYESDKKSPAIVRPRNGGLTIQHAGGAVLSPVPCAPDTFFYPNTVSFVVFESDSSGTYSRLTLNYEEQVYRLNRTAKPMPERPPVFPISHESLLKCLGTYSLIPGYDLELYTDVTTEKEGEHRFGIVTSIQYTAYRRIERIMMRLGGSDPMEVYARSDTSFVSTNGRYTLTLEDERNNRWNRITLRYENGGMEGKRR